MRDAGQGISEDASEISRHLSVIAGIHRGHDPSRDLRWSSVEEMLVEVGLPFGPVPVRAGLVGETRACFSNAMRAVLQAPHRLAYCEGYAISGTPRFPVHHAWVMDLGRRGRGALEVTWPREWRKPGDDFLYLGVPIDTEFALGALGTAGCVFYDHRAGFPMLSRDVPVSRWWHASVPLPAVDAMGTRTLPDGGNFSLPA